MPSYKVKDKSDISSEQVFYILEAIVHLQEKLKKLRAECNHDYEILSESWYDDGYSQVEVGISVYVHCKICGYTDSQETGRTRRCNC